MLRWFSRFNSITSQTTLAAAWKAGEVLEKWNKSAWARKLIRQNLRASLSDLDRFKLMLARKKVRVRVSVLGVWIARDRKHCMMSNSMPAFSFYEWKSHNREALNYISLT